MRPPICVPCSRPMHRIESGVTVEFTAFSTAKKGDGVQGPYEKIQADRFECPGCASQVVTDYARGSLAHFEPEYVKSTTGLTVHERRGPDQLTGYEGR